MCHSSAAPRMSTWVGVAERISTSPPASMTRSASTLVRRRDRSATRSTAHDLAVPPKSMAAPVGRTISCGDTRSSSISGTGGASPSGARQATPSLQLSRYPCHSSERPTRGVTSPSVRRAASTAQLRAATSSSGGSLSLPAALRRVTLESRKRVRSASSLSSSLAMASALGERTTTVVHIARKVRGLAARATGTRG